MIAVHEFLRGMLWGAITGSVIGLLAPPLMTAAVYGYIACARLLAAFLRRVIAMVRP